MIYLIFLLHTHSNRTKQQTFEQLLQNIIYFLLFHTKYNIFLSFFLYYFVSCQIVTINHDNLFVFFIYFFLFYYKIKCPCLFACYFEKNIQKKIGKI